MRDTLGTKLQGVHEGGAIPPDWQPAEEKGDDAQTLPALRDGETAALSGASIQDKQTRPPPRYHEGTLIDAMQNAWRFVTDEALQQRLKEAKGIGTPATRAEIIRGLKDQNMFALQGKTIVPTERGLSVFKLLQRADPALVDPGVTAQLELLLDEVLVGRTQMMAAIDAVCTLASRIIRRLTEQVAASGLPVLTAPALSQHQGHTPTAGGNKVAGKKLAGRQGLKRRPGDMASAETSRASAIRRSGPTAKIRPTAATVKSSTRHGVRKRNDAGPAKPGGKGAAPTPVWPKPVAPANRVADTETRLRIPFGNKEVAMRLGARYRDGAWYAPAVVDLSVFRERGWL